MQEDRTCLNLPASATPPVKTVSSFFLVLVLCASPLAAQDLDEPISTSRPGITSGTGIVQTGAVQIEVGTPHVTHADRLIAKRIDDENRVLDEVRLQRRLISFPTLLRVGVLSWLEVRAASPVYNFADYAFEGPVEDFLSPEEVEARTEGREGTGRLSVGLKGRLLRGAGAVPSVSLAPFLTLPLGEPPFTVHEGVGFGGTLAAGWALPAQLSAVLNAGVDLTPVEGTDDYVASTTFAGALSRPLRQSLSAYVEGAFTTVDGEHEAGYAGAGLTYRLVPTAQLDAFFDRGLNADAADWLFGGGVSIRFGD